MPIHVPGKRSRRGHASPTKRKVVAALSLTAMVDMFTVLVVFLLQNYAVTGEILEMDKSVELPKAQTVKELKPSNVIVISDKMVTLNSDYIPETDEVKKQDDWVIVVLKEKIEQPVFIVGMPRSGTTILHAMLHEDPDHRSPQAWECLLPHPVPKPENYTDNEQLNTVRKEFGHLFKFVPDFLRKHY